MWRCCAMMPMLLLCIWLGRASHAQESAPTSEPPGERSFLLGDKITGDWAGLRPKLKSAGLTIDMSYTQEYLGVASGGLKRGGAYDALTELDLQLDLAAATGDRWKGATLHASMLDIIGASVSAKFSGDEGNVSNINFRNGVRLYECWLEQQLGAFDIRVGQLVSDTEFFTTDTGAVFLNSDFGAIPALSFNVTPPIYAAAAPGVRLRVNPTKAFYVQGAAFDGNPAPDLLGDHTPGFVPGTQFNDHSIRFNLNKKEGALFLLEAGLSIFDDSETNATASQSAQTSAKDTPRTGLPGKYKIGGFYHSDTFTDFRTGNGITGNLGYTASFDQMIWRKEGKQGLFLYGRVGGAEADRSILNVSFDTGINIDGCIPSRDSDVFGIGFAYNHYGSSYSNFMVNQGGHSRSYEGVLEATYRLQLTPGIALQPDFQYVIHPAGRSDIRSAVVVGIRSSIAF